MISVTSATDKYIVQPGLLDKHRKTLDWLSACMLWKHELVFFQKLLDQYAPKFTDVEDKQKIDHFQNLILYYKNELIADFSTRLRQHEKHLADMLETHDETQTLYFKEHNELMNQVEAFNKQLVQYKEDFFSFIEKAM